MKTVTLQHDLIHTGNNKVLLDSNAIKLLSSLMDKLNGWEQIAAVSGFQSMQEQKVIYSQSLKDNGKTFTEKFVALPGHSEHQTGLAIDLALKQEYIDFICPDFPYTGICQTFRQEAISYGFIITEWREQNGK